MINILQKLLFNGGAISILFGETTVLLFLQGGFSYTMIIMGIMSLFLGVYPFMLIRMCKNKLAPLNVRVDTISPKEKMAIIFEYSSYAVPLANLQWEGINVFVLIGISICIMLIFVRINGVVDNLILLLFGYHTYTVKLENGVSDYTFISKKTIRNSNQIKQVYRVSDYLLLEGE